MALSLRWEPLVGLEATAGWRNMEVVSIVFVWILLENKQTSGVVLTFMSLKFNLDPFFNVNDWLKWKTELFSASEVKKKKWREPLLYILDDISFQPKSHFVIYRDSG